MFRFFSILRSQLKRLRADERGFLNLGRGPLMDGEGEGSGGGDGKGEDDKPLTKAEVEALVKAGVTDATKGLEKKLTKISTETSKTIKESIAEALKGLKSADGDGSGDGDGDGSGDGDGEDHPEVKDPKIAAELRKMRKRQQDLEKQVTEKQKAADDANQRAEQTRLRAEVRTSLAEVKGSWRKGTQEQALTLILATNPRADDDGNIVVGSEDSPVLLSEFIEQQLDGPWAPWIETAAAGGSGAKNQDKGGAKGFDIEDIKPGMSPETRAAAMAAIAKAQ